MKIKFMYENNGLLIIFCGWMESQKLKNAKIKMLRFRAQIAKNSNRRKYPLYGMFVCILNLPEWPDVGHHYKSVLNYAWRLNQHIKYMYNCITF